jgi:hypothetical protein
MTKPLDLRDLFGAKWRVGLDEAANGRWTDPWNQIVLCRHGHIYPQAEGILAAATNRGGKIVRKLRAIKGAEVLLDGDDGANVAFPAGEVRAAARVMRPRVVRKLSQAQLDALARGRRLRNPLE